jgi:hypothetical protein
VRYREGKRARRGFELTSRRANLQVHLVGAEQRPPRQKLRRSGGQLGGGAADERRAGGAARMRRVRAEHGAGLTIGAWARRWGPDSNPTRRGGSSSSRSRAKVRLGKGRRTWGGSVFHSWAGDAYLPTRWRPSLPSSNGG